MVYPIGKILIAPVYRLWIRNIKGIENVPEKDACIIAANHSSYYDALVIPSIIAPRIDKEVHALVNSHYWKPLITRFFLNVWKAVPVYVGREKNSRRKNEMALKKALSYLNNKDMLMIFPEGTRSFDGKLKKGYTGVAKLALKSRIPVLPVGIIGSNNVLPRGKILPRFARCDVRFGKPMFFEKYYNKKPNDKIYEEITRQVMKEIAKLIEQEYNY